MCSLCSAQNEKLTIINMLNYKNRHFEKLRISLNINIVIITRREGIIYVEDIRAKCNLFKNKPVFTSKTVIRSILIN